MQKSIWLLLLLLMMSGEQFGRKARRIHKRRGRASGRTGRQEQKTLEYPKLCEVRYPGFFDPENPTRTWPFGSCPGTQPRCRNTFKKQHHYERCCSAERRFGCRCPNRKLFPEGSFPPHPQDCEKDVINKPSHLIQTERKVTYPGFDNSEQEFPVGTCPWLPYKCHYSQTFSPELCCDPGDFTKEEVRDDCNCPNDKLFPAHETYPGFKNPQWKFPPGFCPGLDDRCKASPTYERGCCTIEPVEIEGEVIPCQCPNFNLYPSGPVDSGLREVDRQLTTTTSLSGVQIVTYDKYEQPDKDFPRGSCPGVPQKCRFSTSFDEDACCDRRISNDNDEDCGCPNYNLFNVHGSYPGYRDPSLEFPPGNCPGVSYWCKRTQNTGFSKEACCGGDCPCSCDSPQNCPNPALFIMES